MRKQNWKQTFLKGVSVFLLAAASTLVWPAVAPATSKMVVTGSVVNVRSGPSTADSIVAKVQKNDQVHSLETRGDWHKINLNGVEGWIAGWLLAPSTPAAPPSSTPGTVQKVRQATPTSPTINVRTGPGTSHGIAATIHQGQKYPVVDVQGHWVKINLPDGKSGWVAGWLVAVSSTEVTPAPSPPSPPASNQPAPAPNPPPTSQPETPPAPEENKEAVIKENSVYIRGGPGTDERAIRLVSRGQRLRVLEQAGEWYKVRTDGGIIGWVAGWVVNVEQAEASPSPGDPPVETGDTDRSDEMPAGLQTRLEKLEVNKDKERTLISLQADGQLNYDMFLLDNPHRLVIDLKNTDPGDLPDTMTVGTAAVQKIRTGWFSKEPPVLRIVLDLNGPVVNLDKLSPDRTRLDLDVFIPADGSYLAGRVIILDPGHGGNDPGAVGPSGIMEKDINLDISLKLAQILREKGARVILTRTGDGTVGLYERAPLAATHGADVFLSIHSNGSTSPSSNGTSTYYRRDSGDVAPGVSQADNRRLASAIQSELLRTLGRRNLGVLQANFVVLRTAPVPAALAEIAFITNAEEERLLNQDTFRMRAAEALARGLNTYFSTAR